MISSVYDPPTLRSRLGLPTIGSCSGLILFLLFSLSIFSSSFSSFLPPCFLCLFLPFLFYLSFTIPPPLPHLSNAVPSLTLPSLPSLPSLSSLVPSLTVKVTGGARRGRITGLVMQGEFPASYRMEAIHYELNGFS